MIDDSKGLGSGGINSEGGIPEHVEPSEPWPRPLGSCHGKKWSDVVDERDDEGNLTSLALALDVIEGNGCDCGTDELGSCISCVCKRALMEQWERIARFKSWVSDLQSGMYVNCVYCGHKYGPAKNTPTSMADVLTEHILECPDHPASLLKKKLEFCEQMYNGLMSMSVRDRLSVAVTQLTLEVKGVDEVDDSISEDDKRLACEKIGEAISLLSK